MPGDINPVETFSTVPRVADDLAPPRAGSRSRIIPRRADGSSVAAAALDHAAIRTIIAGIMLAMFLSALEQTIVAPALPSIGKSLGNIDDLPWVVTAYLLAATATTPLFGKLSDIHGRRAILLLAIVIFIAGSVVCALASTIWVLMLARCVQGIGGGGLLPIGQTIIADMLSPRERPLAQSYTSVMFMGASILGPVLGGLLTDQLHWSFIFWINLPLGAVALVMTSRALRRLPRHDRPHRLDLLGGALMVVAALALMLALNCGGVRYRWISWQVLSLLAASAALWLLFAVRLLTAREPFIPLAILRGRVTSMITCAAFFSIGTVIGVTIFSALYCQVVLGASPSVSGFALITFMGGATIGAVVTGRLLARLTHYLRVPAVGLLVAIATLSVLAVEADGLSLGRFALLLGILGLAIGPMYPTSTVVMQNAVKLHELGTATGTLNFFRLLGGAIIVAAFGAIVLGNAGNGGGVMSATLTAGHADFAAAFRLVFAAAAVCLAIALACVLAVEELPLHGPARAVETAPQ